MSGLTGRCHGCGIEKRSCAICVREDRAFWAEQRALEAWERACEARRQARAAYVAHVDEAARARKRAA